MDPAAEVARIKAEFAARNAAWMAAIRAKLERGPATTGQLAETCGCGIKGPFSTFLSALRRAGVLEVIGTRPGPMGFPNLLWEWARDSGGRHRDLSVPADRVSDEAKPKP